MTRTRLASITIAALIALILAASASPKSLPQLFGSIGGTSTIGLKDRLGKSVKTLRAGRYVFTIRDRSSACNFHLKGPGVNNMTSVAKQSNASWLVAMGPGTYTFFCDTHRKDTIRSFHVS